MNLASCLEPDGRFNAELPIEIHAHWNPEALTYVAPSVEVAFVDAATSRRCEIRRAIIGMVNTQYPKAADAFYAAMPKLPHKAILVELGQMYAEKMLRRVGYPGSYKYLRMA